MFNWKDTPSRFNTYFRLKLWNKFFSKAFLGAPQCVIKWSLTIVKSMENVFFPRESRFKLRILVIGYITICCESIKVSKPQCVYEFSSFNVRCTHSGRRKLQQQQKWFSLVMNLCQIVTSIRSCYWGRKILK